MYTSGTTKFSLGDNSSVGPWVAPLDQGPNRTEWTRPAIARKIMSTAIPSVPKVNVTSAGDSSFSILRIVGELRKPHIGSQQLRPNEGY